MFFEPAANPAFFGPEHVQYRDTLRQFVAREIVPFIDEWEAAGCVPRELYHKAADIGLLGVGFPEEYGGTPADEFMKIVVSEELARAGAGGVSAALGSHTIGLPPIVAVGSAELRQRVAPAVIAGEKISALAITEPGGGSDVAALRTTAVRDGDVYVVNGEKTFITSGVRADYITCAVRTDPQAKGADGISLLLIEGDTPGLERSALQKMGWHASDTATLRFDDCRVPIGNLVGAENAGFRSIMLNFNSERLGMAVMAVMYAQVCLDEAVEWARGRHTFGQPLASRQVIRHKLVDMATRIDSARTLAYELAHCVQHGIGPMNELVARTCMLKIVATQTMQFCADQAVQILGGMGFMRGTRAERIYREVKVMMIGGGSEEIMKDLAARQIGF
ncbi:MAG: acyl-CoA dehydrogenase family protein [Gammaproteobacteria bacterium]|nr:acyl-CoA dehydrogenase family protein [Gammaproteobacteria bacterium]